LVLQKREKNKGVLEQNLALQSENVLPLDAKKEMRNWNNFKTLSEERDE